VNRGQIVQAFVEFSPGEDWFAVLGTVPGALFTGWMRERDRRLFDRMGFDELVAALRAHLAARYPPDIFTGESGDPGARFIALLRAALSELPGGA
jgi:hypothetical protein